MKKFVAFSMGALMALSFSACSNDDDLDGTSDDSKDAGYLNINIITADGTSNTRGVGDLDDAKYQTGTENGVNSVKFYFFNSSDRFVSSAEVFNANITWSTENTTNVEKMGKCIVKVPNYNTEDAPTQVVTIVNPPSNIAISEGEKITELLGETDNYLNGSNYVMSTSSYKRTDGTKYYVTSLSSSNFAENEVDAADASKTTAVDVYVERLAAKVDAEFTAFTADQTPLFKLGYFHIDGADEKTQLAAKFLGWGLNATTKTSYVIKKIDETWGDANGKIGGFVWNDPTNFRSYWAWSTTYSAETKDYPKKYTTYNDSTAANDIKTVNGKKYNYGEELYYISANEMKGHNFGSANPLYCNENTNSATCINQAYIPGAATCVLMLAQLTDASGNKLAYDVVKFRGTYYKEATFLKNAVFASGIGEEYFKTLAEGKVSDPITADDVYCGQDSDLNGRILVQITDEAAKKTWYDKDGKEVSDIKTAIKEKMEIYQGSNDAILYRDGLMYYYTPIYHLSTIAPTVSDDKTTYAEGYYGVVRNHWYQVKIAGFKKSDSDSPYDPTNPGNDPSKDDDNDNDPYGPEGPGEDDDPIDPGHGIDDPDEPIIPNPDNVTNYYLSANINILSWRLVGQYVKL